MIFQQIMALMTILQLHNLSHCQETQYSPHVRYHYIKRSFDLKKKLATFLRKYLFNDLTSFIYKFAQTKLCSTSRVYWLRFVY